MKSVCVYCGSRKPLDNAISKLATQLGERIAQKNWTIVYGGGKVGIMGVVADAALSKQGEVIGVIPTHLKKLEVEHTGITKLHETQDMHTRKALMESLSDVFVVLPGGFGTLDEFFEILTWRQLGIHNKPIILVNINGYFDGLEAFTKRAISEDFIREKSLELYQIAYSLDECFEMLER
ncbi:MAG: TIGR00730 family Rossman fold protein [Balneolaceae bacterium]